MERHITRQTQWLATFTLIACHQWSLSIISNRRLTSSRSRIGYARRRPAQMSTAPESIYAVHGAAALQQTSQRVSERQSDAIQSFRPPTPSARQTAAAPRTVCGRSLPDSRHGRRHAAHEWCRMTCWREYLTSTRRLSTTTRTHDNSPHDDVNYR